ncbi:UNVERIFIED_ORG: hypothetical protein GGE44_000571 [Rhizobium esperanzae]
MGWRRIAAAIPLPSIVGFATEFTPFSVVLGLDPRTHAGLVGGSPKAWDDGEWVGHSQSWAMPTDDWSAPDK